MDIETREAAEQLRQDLQGATITNIEWDWRQDSMNPEVWHIQGASLHLEGDLCLDLTALGWHDIQSLIVEISTEPTTPSHPAA